VANVTILGAGAMGSALATPAAAAGNRVRLWGTWLDDELLVELRAGRLPARDEDERERRR
jgi:glycerol-3-phosphate dehydrogenase (NAD(P)+)